MNDRRPYFPILLMATLSLFTTVAPGQTTRASKPDVAIKVVTEDKQKLIQATVTLNGKPLEGVSVSFLVKRTFGNLLIGQDKTLDDGTAAVPFPVGLPAGSTGRLQVIATTTAPPRYADGRGTAQFEGASTISVETFPRALWAPRAPALLVLTIAVILLSVWGCYAFVAVQLLTILRNR